MTKSLAWPVFECLPLRQIANALALMTLMVFMLFASAVRAEPLRLGEELTYSMLTDPSGKLAPDEVLALPPDRFKKMEVGVAQGFTRDVVWLRIDLPQVLKDGRERYLEIAPPFLQSVRLYESRATDWSVQASGSLEAYSKREIKHRNFVFRIASQGDRPLLIRIETTTPMVVLGRLWEPAEFEAERELDIVRWGVYFGAVAILILFMFGAAIIFRNLKLALLSATSALMTVHIINLQGFPARFLENASPALLSNITGMGGCLVSAANIYVLRILVTRGRNTPRLDRLLLGLAIFATLCAIGVPLGFYGKVLTLTQFAFVLAACIGLVLAVRQLNENRRLSQYLLVASISYFLLLLIPVILVLAGILPGSRWILKLWFALLLYSVLVCIPVLLEIFQEYQAWQLNQKTALERARFEEKILEETVNRRTADLLDVQEQLRKSLDHEREIMLEQKQFVSMVSHEFRTPLAILDSAAINLTAVPASDINELGQRTGQMRRAIQRLNHLVNNCLAGDRIEQGAFTLQADDISVADMGKEAMQLVSLAPEHQFDVDMSAAPLTWSCDPTLIRIALSNLLDNAIKNSQGKKVFLSVTQEGEFLVMKVTNNGAGISQDNIARIFEKYVQVGQSRQGVGLGLFVSRQIAKLHGGDISVASIPAEVTTFSMRIGWADKE